MVFFFLNTGVQNGKYTEIVSLFSIIFSPTEIDLKRSHRSDIYTEYRHEAGLFQTNPSRFSNILSRIMFDFGLIK